MYMLYYHFPFNRGFFSSILFIAVYEFYLLYPHLVIVAHQYNK